MGTDIRGRGGTGLTPFSSPVFSKSLRFKLLPDQAESGRFSFRLGDGATTAITGRR